MGTSFQKSRSVDVSMDGSGSTASRFADYTTTASAASANKTEEDIPDWKRRMLERKRKKRRTGTLDLFPVPLCIPPMYPSPMIQTPDSPVGAQPPISAPPPTQTWPILRMIPHTGDPRNHPQNQHELPPATTTGKHPWRRKLRLNSHRMRNIFKGKENRKRRMKWKVVGKRIF